jgi:hypothetical protein
MKTGDDIYARAREILSGEPTMGKKRLADRLGIKTPTSRRLIWRFRGETQGHSTDPVYLSVRTLKDENPEWGPRRIAQELHISEDHAMMYLARWMGAQQFQSKPGTSAGQPTTATTPEAPHAGSTLQDAVGETTRDLCYRGPEIRTLQDLLVYAQVDTSVWEVERWVANKWEVGARNPATGEILTAPLFQIKAWLRRKIVENSLKEFKESLTQALKMEAPVRPAMRRASRGEGMLEVALMDLHYGKLCWGEECGRDYNPVIAEKMFWDAIDDLLAKSAGLKPEKILFPVGNDFYHTDILGKTTSAGTMVDSAIVWKQAFVQGWRLLAQGIERLRATAPVEVVVVSGNHDVMGAFHLGEVLQAHFHRTEGVTVDNTPTQRKYVAYHKCLLGLTHGSEEKFSNLPMLLATERKEDWARSVPAAREFHIGHLHHKKSLQFLPAADVSGVLIRVIPSLTPLDSWHASKGFGSKLAAEAYYWDPECGVTVTLTHSPG